MAANQNLINHRLAATELHDRLSRFVRRRVNNAADADDLLQDIFVKVLAADKPRRADRLLPWLFTIARNRVVDYYRALGRQPETVDVDLLEIEAGIDEDDHSSELTDSLVPMMALLSRTDRHALLAVDLQGLSQKDYAETLGIDYTTAKSRVQRARKRLRKELDNCCEILLDRRGSPIECLPRAKSCCDCSD